MSQKCISSGVGLLVWRDPGGSRSHLPEAEGKNNEEPKEEILKIRVWKAGSVAVHVVQNGPMRYDSCPCSPHAVRGGKREACKVLPSRNFATVRH